MVFSFLETMFNVCRTVYDVIHILFYVFIFLIGVLIAFYKFDKTLFGYYVYLPLLLNIFLIKSYSFRFKLFFKNTVWAPITNRSPYITKTIKNIWNKFFK